MSGKLIYGKMWKPFELEAVKIYDINTKVGPSKETHTHAGVK